MKKMGEGLFISSLRVVKALEFYQGANMHKLSNKR